MLPNSAFNFNFQQVCEKHDTVSVKNRSKRNHPENWRGTANDWRAVWVIRPAKNVGGTYLQRINDRGNINVYLKDSIGLIGLVFVLH
ncbi:hypothetical protein L3Q82_006859 [Scortum barcoo]|uniref:Uncharacterized protein n=1 Tax=Scortum barcoo TaxID=214431 RepID=A0ACB8WVZ9_9TELE|nr:hypothetical protein L3Q82_006859 [Scortum barcoo]